MIPIFIPLYIERKMGLCGFVKVGIKVKFKNIMLLLSNLP